MRSSDELDTIRALSRQLQKSGEQINQIRAVFNQMANTLQNEPDSILHSPTRSNHYPMALFEGGEEKHLQLFPGFGKQSHVISNPSLAMAAIVAESMKRGPEFGKGSKDPSTVSWNTLGNGGTRYTLNEAAHNPQVWKFIDPMRAEERVE